MSAISPPSVSIALTAAGERGRSIWHSLLIVMAGLVPGMTKNMGLEKSGRLLRRHLVHLPGLQIDAHALDLVEVGAGDAHKARIVGIVDRVDGAVLVDAGHAGLAPIFLDRLEP